MPIPLLSRYTHWLHTRWPAGTTETLPVVNADGSTNVTGLWVVGDLAGVPLLKFSADSGAKVVGAIQGSGVGVQGSGDSETDLSAEPASANAQADLLIIGAGVAGMSAALEARKRGISFKLLEAAERFSTIVNFPKAKPIYTYPEAMEPAGELHFRQEVHPKETLLKELAEQSGDVKPEIARVTHVTRGGGELKVHVDEGEPLPAKAVIIAIGRSGNYRKLGVAGEERDKVSNRLHDPKDFDGNRVLVVGGGDSALETAIATAEAGATVTLSYRKEQFGRPKAQNVERLDALKTDGDAAAGKIKLLMPSEVKTIEEGRVVIDCAGEEMTIDNDNVFTMIGREPPLDFFRKSGVKIHNERTTWWWVSLIGFLIFCTALYSWKSGHSEIPLQAVAQQHNTFPYNVPQLFKGAGGKIAAWSGEGHEGNILYTIKMSASSPSFYYTLAYCAAVVGFGIARIRRRKTSYVKWQTLTLMTVQCVPLFILPEILLPWLGRNGYFSSGGTVTWLADHLWERYDDIGHERAYWRSYGFILAFPLNVYNIFTDKPLWLWIGISFVQTCVIIPGLIYFWGKGAYCGWICSCGALAETMGDQHREKMPHGPLWNRLNMLGQAVLAFALIILLLRTISWNTGADSWAGKGYHALFAGIPFLRYEWSVDILLAGIFGYGLYFWFSGRVWCRFACPLAALMHIYARFSRFAIVPEKKKCISCNVCTSVCHQGIDVMAFANKGTPMQDPECVRCSACVQMCPTGVLTFGMVDNAGKTIRLDKTNASLVQLDEVTVNGQKRESMQHAMGEH